MSAGYLTQRRPKSCRFCLYLFEFRRDLELLKFVIERDAQHIRLAADLAVLNVLLAETGRVINLSVVPLATACTLEAGFHDSFYATAEPPFSEGRYHRVK